MNKVILDTNAYRKLYDNDSKLSGKIEHCDYIYMSPIVLGELLGGFKKGNQEKLNIAWLDRFLESRSIEVKEIGLETAKIYAYIKNELGKTGKPIPSNDIWIAAQAMEIGAVLITYDKHFEEISGLRVWGE